MECKSIASDIYQIRFHNDKCVNEKRKFNIKKILIHPNYGTELQKDKYFKNYFYLPTIKQRDNGVWRVFCSEGFAIPVYIYPYMSLKGYCVVLED